METCFNYCDKDAGFFSSDERRWITRIHKLKEKYPDQIKIIAEPETNEGCIYCRLPVEWLRVQPPKKMNFSDEQKAEFTTRLRNITSGLS